MLNVAVVAFNFDLSCKALRVLAENDQDSKIKRMQKDVILMEDGTKYRSFPTYNHTRGHIVDQVIIVDDCRWKVYNQQSELINWLKYRMDCVSCVPEEFQIQEYEW